MRPLARILEHQFAAAKFEDVAVLEMLPLCMRVVHARSIATLLIIDANPGVVPYKSTVEAGNGAIFDEDVLVLDECMQRHKPDWQRAFEAYYEARKHDVDALADLAISNFVEMRDHTGLRGFLWKKKKERILHRLFPRWYIPLYTMATFTRMPYVAAVERARKQDTIVFWVAIAIFVILLGAVLTVFG